MEILVISHKYPPSIGGMQKHCFELVQNLKRSNTVHEVIFTKGSKFGFLVRSSFRAKRLLKKYPNIDLIYANDGLMAFFLTPLFWRTKVPIVVTAHGLDVVFPLQFYQKWLYKYFNKARGIIAVSDGTTKELLDRKVQAKKVFTVRNGFDPSENSIEASPSFLEERLGVSLEGKKVLVSIGRSVKRKGFSWMVDQVLPSLGREVIYIVIGPKLDDHRRINWMKKYLPNWLFRSLVLLVGIPLDEIVLQEKIKERGYHERVFHLSGLSNDEVTAVLKTADLYVMPNLSVPGDYEGFGLVALEAVTAGLLCVAAEIDGIPSAIQHDSNGILLPSGDHQDWIDKVSSLLDDDQRRNELASRYKANAVTSCLSWTEMADEYEKVFQQIVEEDK